MIDEESATAVEPTETTTTEALATDDPPSAGGDTADPIADALSAAYDEIQARGSEDEATAPEQKEATEAKAEGEPQDEPASDQPKSEDGEPVEQGHADPAIDLPNSWSDDLKAKWAAIPHDMQKHISDREAEAHEQISRQGEALATYEPIRQVFEHFPQYQNQDPGKFVGNLVAAQAFLDRDPVAGLKWLADAYKVDLGNVSGQSDGYQDDDLFKDPRVDQLQAQLQPLRQQVEQLTGQLTSQQKAEAEARHTDAVKAIETYKADKPYWGVLEADIGREIAFIRSTEPNLSMKATLERAYQRAENNSEVVRAKVAEDSKAKAEEEAAKKAAEAGRKAKSNVKARTSTKAVNDSRWDDDSTLSAEYDRITAG